MTSLREYLESCDLSAKAAESFRHAPAYDPQGAKHVDMDVLQVAAEGEPLQRRR